MENTLENKAKFFAQYWGQEILSDGCELGGVCGDCEDNLFLLLKPLSSITDEDAIEMAKIEQYEPSGKIVRRDFYGTDMIQVLMQEEEYSPTATLNIMVSGYIYWDNNDGYEDNSQSGVNTAAYDYLRSKGYALPFMGLSVEEQISRGWIKLKTE